MPRSKRQLPMTLDAVKGYASEVLTGAARGEHEMVSLVGYLAVMVEEGSHMLDSKLVCALYFVAAYTLALHDRDNSAAETSAIQRWSGQDARALADHVRGHPRRVVALDRNARAMSWPA